MKLLIRVIRTAQPVSVVAALVIVVALLYAILLRQARIVQAGKVVAHGAGVAALAPTTPPPPYELPTPTVPSIPTVPPIPTLPGGGNPYPAPGDIQLPETPTPITDHNINPPPTPPDLRDPMSMVYSNGQILPPGARTDALQEVVDELGNLIMILPPSPPENSTLPDGDLVGPQATTYPDTRTRVTDTRKFEYSAIAQLTFTFPNGAPATCTGFLIDNNTVATVAHCVYNKFSRFGREGWVANMIVTPGKNADPPAGTSPEPYGTCRGIEFIAPLGWVTGETDDDSNYAYDFAAVKLDCGVGKRTNWMGLMPVTLADLAREPEAIVTGYPGDKRDSLGNTGTTQWTATGKAKSAGSIPNQFAFDTDASSGQSGSPVYRTIPTCTLCAYGIFSNSIGDDNLAVQISEAEIYFFATAAEDKAFVSTFIARLPQSAGYDSEVRIRNLSKETATINIGFYAEATGALVWEKTDTIGGNLSKRYASTGVPIYSPGGYQGSLVVTSDQAISAVGNLIEVPIPSNKSYNRLSTFTAPARGATTVKLPLIMRHNSGYTTWIAVQNTGNERASVTVRHISGFDMAQEEAVLEPGQVHYFDQEELATLGGGGPYVGSAEVTSSGLIIATVHQRGHLKLLSYDGFVTRGRNHIVTPLVMANNSGYFTGIQVQNAGTESTTVVVSYGSNTATTADSVTGKKPCVNTSTHSYSRSLEPGASMTVLHGLFPLPEKEGYDYYFHYCSYVGNATISADQPLVAIVNELNSGQANFNSASTYESFSPEDMTGRLSLPLVMANVGSARAYTGVQVQNAGPFVENFVLNYGPNVAPSGANNCPTPLVSATKPFSLAPNTSKTFIQAGGDEAKGYDNQFATCTYIGSVYIEGSGGTTVTVGAIVNQVELAYPFGDELSTYNGHNIR